jgi:DNA integrity scanning protein DisA with diadenylate cyclase activity
MLESIFFLLQVAVAFVLFYLFIPFKVVKFDKKSTDFTTLDRFVISFIHMNLVTIALVHLLALCQIYETVSLFVAYLLVLIVYTWIKKRNQKNASSEEKGSTVARVLDSIEVNDGGFNMVKNKLKSWFHNLGVMIGDGFKRFIKNPIGPILVVAVFAFGAYVRFSHSVEHAYYGASDPYVHLAWTKYLGSNIFYYDGVYPLGYNSLISALSKISFIDPYIIIRYIGAIGGCMIIFSIFYIMRKSVKNVVIPALFAIAVYVLGTELPINTWRQMSALPQEYAMMFILPGIYFLQMYFEKKENKFVFLAAEVLALTLLIHTYAAVILTAGYILICLMNLRTFLRIRIFAKFAGIMIAAGIIGLLPIAVGLLSGIKFHQMSIDFIYQGGGIPENVSFMNIFAYVEKDPAFLALLLSIAVLAVVSIIGLFYKKEENKTRSQLGLAFALITSVLYIQFRADVMQIPALMEKSRTGTFLGLCAVVVLGLLIGSIGMLPFKKFLNNVLKLAACAVLAVFLFNIANFSMPIGTKTEYDETANAYIQIKSDYPTLNWTIVSTVEQYSEVMGYGWHYQMWEFIRDQEAAATGALSIPTDYIFWFVEKIPLNQSDIVTEADSKAAFPVVTGNSDQYYTIAANRRIVQAKAYYWLENYRLTHSNMSIFLDTEYVRIYMIKQDGTNPVNLLE